MQTVAEHADLYTAYERRLAPCLSRAAFVLRITEWKALPVPVLVIKERQGLSQTESTSQLPAPFGRQAAQHIGRTGTSGWGGVTALPAHHALHPGAGLR